MLYGATAAVAAVPLLRLGRRPAPLTVVLALAVVASLCHFAGLVAYAQAAGELPISGLAPALSSLGFFVAVLAAAILWLTGEASIVLVASPLVVFPVVMGLLAGFRAPDEPPSGEGAWFLLHVATSLLGLALLAVAFVAAALYLAQHRALKGRRFGVVFRFFPPLEELDRLNYLALLVGFPVLTLGVVLAMGFADRSAGGFGVTAAHLGWGFLSWGVLGGIAGARAFGWLRGKRAAYASIGAFLAVSVSYLVLQAVTAGGARFL